MFAKQGYEYCQCGCGQKAPIAPRNIREERTALAREYQTVNEAQDAYGWDIITEDEYRAIVKAIEAGEEYVENTTTPADLAAKILTDFTSRLSSELRSLEFELLPVEEQVKRMEAADKRREEMEARRAARKEARP